MTTNVSGMSYKGIAISEKHSDMKFSLESRRGIPFNFLMRDILQFDNSVYDAMRYVGCQCVYHLFVYLLVCLSPVCCLLKTFMKL